MSSNNITRRIGRFFRSIRVSKNGLIVELAFIVCVGALVLFSCTVFRAMLRKVNGIRRGFCNVTEIQMIGEECSADVTLLPTVSGYFIYDPTDSEWEKYQKESAFNKVLRNALHPAHQGHRRGRVLTSAPTWTHYNLTLWDSQFYDKMFLKWKSIDSSGRFPYREILGECARFTSYQDVSLQLVAWFPWLRNYSHPKHTKIKMGFRSCDLFQPTNSTLVEQSSLKDEYLWIVGWLPLLVLGTLSVGPVTRRGDEPFRSVCVPLWWLIKGLFFIPHAVIFWLCAMTGCAEGPVSSSFQCGSILFPLILCYLSFEEKYLAPPPPAPPTLPSRPTPNPPTDPPPNPSPYTNEIQRSASIAGPAAPAIFFVVPPADQTFNPPNYSDIEDEELSNPNCI